MIHPHPTCPGRRRGGQAFDEDSPVRAVTPDEVESLMTTHKVNTLVSTFVLAIFRAFLSALYPAALPVIMSIAGPRETHDYRELHL